MSSELQELIETYRRSAVAHGEATASGAHKEANRHYEVLVSTLQAMKSHGDAGKDALLSLLDADNPSVRCWSATHSLHVNELRAKQTLAALAAGVGIVAFNAETVLEEWDKGSLKEP